MEYNKENQPPCYDCVMWLRRGATETKEGRLPAERYCRHFPDVHDVIKRREITNNFECFRKRKCDTDRKSEMWQRANRLNGAFSDLPADVRYKVFADMAEMERRNIKVKREEVDKELFDAVFVHLKKKYKGLGMIGTMVYYKGECRFNTDGYNLLRNLTELCDVLKEELK